MLRLTKTAIVAAVSAGAIAAPAAAMAAPVNVTGFTLSPSCTHPGGTVAAKVTVQNTTLLTQTFYAQTKTYYFGALVQTSQVQGPYNVPPLLSFSTTQQQTVSSNAPVGSYTVVLGIGPSQASPMSWSTRSAPLTVKLPPAC
jgi:hypothetical protein